MKRTLSLVLAALLLAGCAGPAERTDSPNTSGGTAPVKMNYALSEPVYPEFPKEPEMPVEGSDEEWEAYSEAYEKYIDALLAVRGENSSPTDEETAALNTFAVRSTPLALEGQEGKNAVYSPLSLWSALALLAQCAEGDSRRQVLDALGAADVDELQERVSRVWQTLYTDDGKSSLILGNSIWLNDGAEGTYVPDTLDTLARKYFAGTYSVPMGTDEADRAVSGWMKEQTNGLIGGGDAPVYQTRAETLVLLMSSLYYRAAWLDEFPKEATEQDIFTAADGQESQADFMHMTRDDGFLRREGWQAAQLSTSLGEMVFVLPDEGVTPESLLQNPEFLPSLEFSDKTTILGEVRWSVPKFDVDSDLGLLDTLSAMGVTDLLDSSKADLSALTDLDAYLSEAKQLARVKVDEEGVEAAAVTIMALDECAMWVEEPEVCVMDLDRPFLFVIRFQDVPLFIGVVNQV